MSNEGNKRDGAAVFAERLNNNEPPPPKPTHNFFVYGGTGTGKTTLVKTLKGDVVENENRVLLLTNDKGSASIQSALHDTDPYRWLIEEDIDEYQDVRDAYAYLYQKEHPFEWVVLDDCTIMAQMLVRVLEKKLGDNTWDIYRELNNRFRRLLRGFRDLDTNVLFLAREGIKEKTDGVKTAAFPGKALGTGNDKSSVLHEFDYAFRAFKRGEADEPEYLLQTDGSDDVEAKKRDEMHVLDLYESPDMTAIRTKIIDAIHNN